MSGPVVTNHISSRTVFGCNVTRRTTCPSSSSAPSPPTSSTQDIESSKPSPAPVACESEDRRARSNPLHKPIQITKPSKNVDHEADEHCCWFIDRFFQLASPTSPASSPQDSVVSSLRPVTTPSERTSWQARDDPLRNPTPKPNKHVGHEQARSDPTFRNTRMAARIQRESCG